MTKHEIKAEAYQGQRNNYLYEGFDAEQWTSIAHERDATGKRAAADEAYLIVEALNELDHG